MKSFPSSAPSRAAFTRIDLLAAICVIGLLMMMAWPALGANKRISDVIECLSNSRQTAQAWLAYTIDNNDTMPGTIYSEDARSGKPFQGPGANLLLAPYQPWCTGWLTWDTNAHNTNTLFLSDPNYSTLAPYTKRSASIFKCTADKYVSTAQRARGWTERARSVSANMYLGNGPASRDNTPLWDYRGIKATKISDLANPAPRFVFMFIEEHPDSMNDPEFIPPAEISPNFFQSASVPSFLHEAGATINYADGGAELHRWNGPWRSTGIFYEGGITGPEDGADNRYLSFRCPKFP